MLLICVRSFNFKPYAFIARPWDTIKHPYDILNSTLTPIIVSTVGGKIVVAPQVNNKVSVTGYRIKQDFF
jgi:hypothetical protein